MAIAFVASGAVQNLEGADLPSHNIPLPAGHASGHLLFLFSLCDDRTGTTATPSGWTKMGEWAAGITFGFLVYTRLEVFWRIDNGSLGSDVAVSYSNAAWPTGDGSVIAWTTAYSGCDTAGPIESFSQTSTTDSSAAQAHPQMTAVTANTWLLTLRAAYALSPRTFTISGGTNAERVDDDYNGVHAAFYDSNSALSTGLQTQRTTTASGSCTGGGTMLSILIKPAPVAGSVTASPSTAEATGTAYDATVTAQNGNWALCEPGQLPDYRMRIDWAGDGSFADAGDDVTPDVISDLTFTYGRDQDRQLAPSSVGSASARLINTDRNYSPEYVSSPLAGNLDPAREMKTEVTYGGNTYSLFRGRIDDFNVSTGFSDRSVSFTFLDGLSLLQGHKLSTGLYASMRTGELISTILDLAGWTGARDIDNGATIVRYWWAEGTDALSAIQDLVKSEGVPSVAYQGPDGTFVFRDRHHRLQRTESRAVQGTYASAAIACDSPAVTGMSFTDPFTYSNGWRDIFNSVSFDVSERTPEDSLSEVWTSDSTVSLGIGESAQVIVSTSDPFKDAVMPVAGTDFTVGGAGTVSVSMSRTSGTTTRLMFLAVGGSVVITGLRLRARAVTVRRTVKIEASDSTSIAQHGEKAYTENAPWASVNDAAAIASTVLLHYAERRPTVQIRLTASTPELLVQILRRTISDRVHITNGEMGLDSDFFVEKVTHNVQRINQTGKPPVHSVTLGCERDLEAVTNPFTFDLRGAGFDEGEFDPIQSDNPDTVFVFDDPGQGRFDVGLFGT